MATNFGNVTCPNCSKKQRMEIPTDKCIPFYKCTGCNQMIKAKSCCVFCDYGDTLCPVSVKK